MKAGLLRIVAYGMVVAMFAISVWRLDLATELQRENEELRGENADLQAVLDDAIGHITRLAQQVIALGGEPGEILLQLPGDEP